MNKKSNQILIIIMKTVLYFNNIGTNKVSQTFLFGIN